MTINNKSYKIVEENTYKHKIRRSVLMKKNQGITLLALVITIIVLLILAGITLRIDSRG